jgi:hypothetical protein
MDRSLQMQVYGMVSIKDGKAIMFAQKEVIMTIDMKRIIGNINIMIRQTDFLNPGFGVKCVILSKATVEA